MSVETEILTENIHLARRRESLLRKRFEKKPKLYPSLVESLIFSHHHHYLHLQCQCCMCRNWKLHVENVDEETEADHAIMVNSSRHY